MLGPSIHSVFRLTHGPHTLRSANRSEIKWIVRTLSANTRAGISLEATVLPSLGAAYVWHQRRVAAAKAASAAAVGSDEDEKSGGKTGSAVLAAKRRKLAGGTSTGADAAKDFVSQ